MRRMETIAQLKDEEFKELKMLKDQLEEELEETKK